MQADYLRKSFQYVGGGLAIVAASAVALHKNGAVFRVMRAGPWAFLGVSLGASIASMLGVYWTDPKNHGQKLLFWTAFQVAQGFTLSPLVFLQCVGRDPSRPHCACI
jgi:FtsH-binding integral membrane protein